MEETLFSAGVDPNSTAVEFVEDFDRDALDPGLSKCIRCGDPPAVCSVNTKHVAAYADMVREGHGLSLLLEDDIALTGPRSPTEEEQSVGLAPFDIHAAASHQDGKVHLSSTTASESNFVRGLRVVLDEARGSSLPQPKSVPVGDPGFDTAIIGECVFTKWFSKRPFLTQVAKHLYQPNMKQGASKCVGAVLVSQSGARRLLQALPFARPGMYNASGHCFRTPGAFPDHHLNMAHRLSGNTFRGLWVVPELCSEMEMPAGEAHIWREGTAMAPRTKTSGRPRGGGRGQSRGQLQAAKPGLSFREGGADGTSQGVGAWRQLRQRPDADEQCVAPWDM